MNRRGFIASMLALGAAPAIVRAASLMSWKATGSGVIAPDAGAVWIPVGEYNGEIFAEEIGRYEGFHIYEGIGARMALTRQMIAYGVLKGAQ